MLFLPCFGGFFALFLLLVGFFFFVILVVGFVDDDHGHLLASAFVVGLEDSDLCAFVAGDFIDDDIIGGRAGIHEQRQREDNQDHSGTANGKAECRMRLEPALEERPEVERGRILCGFFLGGGGRWDGDLRLCGDRNGRGFGGLCMDRFGGIALDTRHQAVAEGIEIDGA